MVKYRRVYLNILLLCQNGGLGFGYVKGFSGRQMSFLMMHHLTNFSVEGVLVVVASPFKLILLRHPHLQLLVNLQVFF